MALVWPLMAGGDGACRAATAQELPPGCHRLQASTVGLHRHQALVGLLGCRFDWDDCRCYAMQQAACGGLGRVLAAVESSRLGRRGGEAAR